VARRKASPVLDRLEHGRYWKGTGERGGSAGYLESLEDALEVFADGVLGHVKLVGNLVVAEADSDQAHHCPLDDAASVEDRKRRAYAKTLIAASAAAAHAVR
jgi:hypothetical protein